MSVCMQGPNHCSPAADDSRHVLVGQGTKHTCAAACGVHSVSPCSQTYVPPIVQQVTSEEIAGVPTHTATPKGFASNSSSSSRLLVYLHGGAYIKGSCDKLWQVWRGGQLVQYHSFNQGGWTTDCCRAYVGSVLAIVPDPVGTVQSRAVSFLTVVVLVPGPGVSSRVSCSRTEGFGCLKPAGCSSD